MAIVIPEDYGLATFKWSSAASGRIYNTTVGFAAPDLLTAATGLGNVVTGLQGAGEIFNAAQMLLGYSFVGADATYVNELGPQMLSAAANVSGTKSGEPVPPNCAFLATKRTARGGRRGRGRFFLPPVWVPEHEINAAGVISSGQVTIVQLLLEGLIAEMSAQDIPAVLLHSDGGTPDEITGVTVQSRLATQRRRLR